MMNPRITSALITALSAVVIVLLLIWCRLSISASQWPPEPPEATELVEMEEEFVELFDPVPIHRNPAPAYAPEEVRRESRPAPAGGTDLADAGEQAPAAPDVTSERPSELTRPKKDVPVKSGPDREQQRLEEARRKARKGISDAFKAADDTPADNTASKGDTPGDSGRPDGQPSDASGTGQGTVGGGWIMPRYDKVASRQTGSIILQATVNRQGRVTSVVQTGGKAPASANAALVEKCMAEVRRHTFTRRDDNAPERATARITYTFR